MPPYKLEIRARAQRDLFAIVLFVAKRNREFSIALRFGQRLLDRCEELAKVPGSGTPYRQRPGIRKWTEGAYKIFYQVTDDKVTILRIWDGRRGRDPVL